MKYYIINILFSGIFILSGLLSPLASYAIALEATDSLAVQSVQPAEKSVQNSYSPTHLKPLDSTAFEKASKGFNFNEEKDKPKKKKKNQTLDGFEFPDFSALTFLIKSIIIIVGAAIIGFLVYYILIFFMNQKNTKIRLKNELIRIENLEEYIHETDLDKFLHEALNAHQYAAAIRVYYLMVIKHLSEKEIIQWKREKTNQDYLRETASYEWNMELNELTYYYEKIWYGDVIPSEELFLQLETRFKNFMNTLKTRYP